MDQQHTNTSSIVLSSIPFEMIASMLRQVVREELESKKKEELADKWLNTEAARKLFEPVISRVTLDTWCKKGLITKYRIGGKPRFKYSEIMEAGKHLKKYGRPQI